MLWDESVFRDGWVPRRLERRDDEQEQLAAALRPAVRGKPPTDVVISGPSGVGKTALAKCQVEALRLEADVCSTHIQCLGTAAGEICRDLVREHPRGGSPAHTAPVEDVRADLARSVDRPYIVVLDEADDVCRTDLLGWLDGIEAVAAVAICHDSDEWLGHLDAATARGRRHIPLETYSVDALASILAQRADLGLRHGAVDRQLLERIAQRCAGVARTGIQMLFEAAKRASEDRRATIEEADIGPAAEAARRRIRASNLSSLPVGHLLVYHLIQQADGSRLSAGALTDRYDDVAASALADHPATPAAPATRRRYLSKLEDYGLITSTGENRHRSYIALDPDLEISDVVDFGVSVEQQKH
jgi:Cdc6-like AAA superfamily ATPase